MTERIEDFPEPFICTATRIYSLTGIEDGDIEQARVRHLVHDIWHDGLGDRVAESIGEDTDVVTDAMGINGLPEELRATLVCPGFEDVKVGIDLDGIDSHDCLTGTVTALAGNAQVDRVVAIFQRANYPIDEIVLALSGRFDDDMYACGTIREREQPNDLGRYVLDVTVMWRD